MSTPLPTPTDLMPKFATPAVADAQSPSPPPAPKARHIGVWALILGFLAFLIWAATAPLDEGVPSPGIVSLDTKTKTIQHQTGGIIKEVLVKEGQQINAGDIVIRLDDVAARANREAIRQRYLSLRTMQGRLQAEQGGQTRISWHPDLIAAAPDPLISQQMRNQQQLLDARRSALNSDLQAIQESIQGQGELAQSYTRIRQNRLNQEKLIREELQNTLPLVQQGYAPRNRQLELERSLSEISAAITESEANVQRARTATAELRQRANSRQQEYRKEVEAQLSDVSREVQSDAERLNAVSDDLQRTEIRSPVAGQVVGLNFQSLGGVIPPGQRIMDIVPIGESLILEARVPPHLIDRVSQGQTVDTRFSAFAHAPQLVVPGTVRSISADVLTDPHTGAGYYLARIAITPEGMTKLGKHQLQAGMPVDVVFKGGERTLLTYLLHPLLKRVAASMKEE